MITEHVKQENSIGDRRQDKQREIVCEIKDKTNKGKYYVRSKTR